MTAFLETQYPSLEHQAATAELGMWAFIASETLFLGALIGGYSFYRYLHPAQFAEAARHTKLVIGAINTLVLLSSSFAMSWAGREMKTGGNRAAGRLMAIAAGLGLFFLALKAYEYAQELGEHLWPDRFFAPITPDPSIGRVFYFLYWVMTGLHALHLLAGIGVVGVIARWAANGAYSAAYHAPVRVASLYWHFVDLVWIFLFVLIYLPGRHG